MTNSFQPKLEILPLAQRRMWESLSAIPDIFTLYGGTAVALHIGHRTSIDFDFFADREFDPAGLYRTVPFLKRSTVIQQEPNTLTCLAGDRDKVKISFFGLPYLARCRAPLISPGNRLKVASLIDLAATKVSVVQQRAQMKDYLDIAAILAAGISLPEALAAAKLVYGDAFNPTPSLKALSYFGDGDLPSLDPDVKARLVKAAAAVDPLRLPNVAKSV